MTIPNAPMVPKSPALQQTALTSSHDHFTIDLSDLWRGSRL